MVAATTDIYTLSLHDALPIYSSRQERDRSGPRQGRRQEGGCRQRQAAVADRSEEHTSELQSRLHLVCRLLLEKKKSFLHGAWPPGHSPPGSTECHSALRRSPQ